MEAQIKSDERTLSTETLICKLELEKHYDAFMGKCCERVNWIMFQDMCTLSVVRNTVRETGNDCPGSDIIDCDVDFWVD